MTAIFLRYQLLYFSSAFHLMPTSLLTITLRSRRFHWHVDSRKNLSLSLLEYESSAARKYITDVPLVTFTGVTYVRAEVLKIENHIVWPSRIGSGIWSDPIWRERTYLFSLVCFMFPFNRIYIYRLASLESWRHAFKSLHSLSCTTLEQPWTEFYILSWHSSTIENEVHHCFTLYLSPREGFRPEILSSAD